MVTTPTNTTNTTIKADSPSISIAINTFLQGSDTPGATSQGVWRLTDFTITVTNVKLTLAISTFQRIFNYVVELANNDINPVPNINNLSINLYSVGDVKTPSGGCTLTVDHSQVPATCNLTLVSTKLRLDYMDDFFYTTIDYLTNAIANDLNPEG